MMLNPYYLKNEIIAESYFPFYLPASDKVNTEFISFLISITVLELLCKPKMLNLHMYAK